MRQSRFRYGVFLIWGLFSIGLVSWVGLRVEAQNFGPPDADIFQSLGTDPNGPAFNFGYAGATFGRSSGFFNVRPDVFATGVNPALYFMTKNAVRMVISKDGNVAIGPDPDQPNNPRKSICPCERLVVNGNISVTGSFISRGMRMIVPDYVFAPDYQLPPLTQVEEYITKEKHLPEVPSAQEIAERGVNMSELQMQLLKKIEELTLYTIAQEKTINELRTRLTQVEAQQKVLTAR
ncbi:MAG: hypothetical protein AB7G75_06110 [Candidatus Binatia bacterium]